MDSLEKKIKKLMSHPGTAKEACPDALELCALIEGTLKPEDELRIKTHLTQCADCFELVRINLDFEENGSSAVPLSALEKARNIFSPTLFQRARQFFTGAGNRGDSPGLAPAFAVRGSELAHSTGLSSHVKDLGPYRAEVEVEKNLDDNYQIRVWVYDRSTKKTVSGMRASLRDQKQDLESLVIEKGRALFEPVPEGEYLLKISHQAMFLGGMVIRLKGEGK
jgi:hypothetical protein